MTTPESIRSQFFHKAIPLSIGDYVVHTDHGIGKFHNLETVWVSGSPHDCLLLLYKDGDKLFVPVENIDKISRHGSLQTTLDKLGTTHWQTRKKKVRQRLETIVTPIIELAASRLLEKAPVFEPQSKEFNTFCARFPYQETPDQQIAIQETLDDLASGTPMDRLICGDVGFGKTEVALRAAFTVASNKAQVAIIVPTILLAYQHFELFQDRFSQTGLRIAMLNRDSPKSLRQEVSEGKIHILIATSSLLSLEFFQLGLVIIDEEQHFGVVQKEKLKTLQNNVHILTLTATPIPRTLQMALIGLRKMSLITTPPSARQIPDIFVLPFKRSIIQKALLEEKSRGGQSLYICPRIQEMETIQKTLADIVPDLRITIANGDISTRQLERSMEEFISLKSDILLATNIVESGIDIPNANTLIVHHADLLGLAQLYQLRGRVGRSTRSSFAYFTWVGIPTPQAQQRLQILQSLNHLGMGFALATHDMEMRGVGNLIGTQQSGHMQDIGVELYHTLLEEAAHALKGQSFHSTQWTPQLNLQIPILIPQDYIPDLSLRLDLYRSLSYHDDLSTLIQNTENQFGPIPESVHNLLTVHIIKRLCRKAWIEKIDTGSQGVTFTFYENSPPNSLNLLNWLTNKKWALTLRTDHKLVWKTHWTAEKLPDLKDLLEELADLSDEPQPSQPLYPLT